MAVVIDEMESTVESGERGSGGSSGGAKQDQAKPMPIDKLAADLQHIARRRERLRAD